MNYSIKTFLFKNFGRELDAAALVSALATACFDIQRCNEAIAQAFAERDANPSAQRWRGDTLYAVRMIIGHFHEAMFLIPKIERNTQLKSMIASCDRQTREEFQYLLSGSRGNLPPRIRNNVSFHYQNIKLFKEAITARSKSDRYGSSKLETASEMKGWYPKFSDDLIETILAKGVKGHIDGDETILLSTEGFGEEIALITDDAKKLLSFGGELMRRFVKEART